MGSSERSTLLSLEEYRSKSSFDVKQMFEEMEPPEYFEIKTKYLLIVNEALEIYNANVSIKIALGVALFANALNCLGSERHKKFYTDVWEGKILSCLAITELEHGSDTKRLKTIARYDALTKEFVINTPGICAAKVWVGNLGKQCTHALLFAQLEVNGVSHGLHGFVVPIRDPQTLQPYLGINVGDLGEKSGLHGIDNGWVMFDNYRIPKENLLNRVGDVNEEGEYETSFTDPQKLLGASLEILSAGRVGIVNESSNNLLRAVIIAVRYAAQRRQFCDSKGIETPLLEYQTHQYRLFPYLAATYVIKNFSNEFSDRYVDCVAASREGSLEMKQVSRMVSGVHAVLCCTKAVITWTTQRAIQETREACGGHGYHKAAGLGDLRNNHDPRVTFEGDNTVLVQQTSNWLLKLYNDPDERDFTVYPLSMFKFIDQLDAILSKKSDVTNVETLCSVSTIMTMYEWLICWLLKTTNRKMDALKSKYNDRFVARNLCQVFKAKELAIVVAEVSVCLAYFLILPASALRIAVQNYGP
ncbi:unnamed protein product [Nesidiocoris tenuis]|uniref:acyl-CoA oxidase n=1 Tax=Nesidiocoris tenuis TaxID=355587 RepID=A0A6H5GYP8_9HEMI|nr:unnamed protein product [Nesidiocoris tenuis]